MDNEVNVLALVKGEERYIFLYDDKNRTETLRILGRYAADPQLSFTWYDAAVMSKKIREMSAAAQPQSRPRPTQTKRFSYRHEEDMI
jgi:hypothetical protein